MERAAVDRKARAVSLQDELTATASEIECEHQRRGGAMTGDQDYAAASSSAMGGAVTSAIA
jgi:hypothetical protein